MNIKKLESINKIYTEIKSIDKKINEVNKMALMIVNKETKIDFTLNVIDTHAKSEEEGKKEARELIEDDGDGVSGIMGFMFGAPIKVATPSKYKLNIKYPFDETMALKMLNLFVNDLKMKRKKLENKYRNIDK